jgi:two-component system response regulator FlrC
MLEAVLFGYEKGAFTGAQTAHAGKFEQAQGGTLLLDEISEMDIDLQAKILRVLQEREVERLGSARTIALDVRVLATSNRGLREEVSAGRFREDLFYRLNVVPLRLPSLRERAADILPLARRALARFSTRPDRAFTIEAETRLIGYEWPGNVRELNNVIQRAAILAAGSLIRLEDLEFEALTSSVERAAQGAAMTSASTAQAEPPAANALTADLKERERALILEAIGTAPSRKEAAARLGISPRTLRHKLAQMRAEGVEVA